MFSVVPLGRWCEPEELRGKVRHRVLLQAALFIFPSAAARAGIVTPDLPVSMHCMDVLLATILFRLFQPTSG